MLNSTLEGRVGVLTIDRPNRRNSLGSELIAQLGSELRRLDGRPDVGSVIVTGSAPGFCAGSDLKELSAANLQEMCRHEDDTAALARSIALLSKPVIAAVEGFAIGGGFALAASCDVVVTHASCRWHMAEVTIGWIPPWGLEALVARCGLPKARLLVWGAEPITGTEAVRLGVADYLAAEGEVLKDALLWAHKFAGLPPVAVAAAKRYFSKILAEQAERGDSEATRIFAENCAHETAQATLRKYGAKR